ncbi:MAG: hypothetical protein PHI86_00300 [Candidatus Omnitrophica bacterium]|nr:hypothetical protein [Candidatus Omnitrophota bacterium]HOX54136.1 hypothetical protein [Candidatus Omnitrophota bacterium]
MLYFLYLIAFLWLVVGLSLLVLPELVRKAYLRKVAKVAVIKIIAIVPMSVGILFFLSTNNLLVDGFGYAMGLVALFKGLTFLLVKKERMTQVINWWVEAPSEVLRMGGVLLLALALTLLSLIVR